MEVIERRENKTKKYIVHCANCGSVLRCEWGDFAMYPNFTSITYAFTCPVCNVRQVISGKELDKSVEYIWLTRRIISRALVWACDESYTWDVK